MEKLGPRTLQSLALVAEVIHGTPARFRDPARFSFAHGGKDRHPFPVPTKVYDRTVEVLQTSLEKAKVGDKERSEGLRRLHRFVLKIERGLEPEANFEELIAHENRTSYLHGGRSVFGHAQSPRPSGSKRCSMREGWRSVSLGYRPFERLGKQLGADHKTRRVASAGLVAVPNFDPQLPRHRPTREDQRLAVEGIGPHDRNR